MPSYHRRYAEAIDASFFIVPVYGLIVFGVPFVIAALWRERRDWHYRLMYVATCALGGAGFIRLPEWMFGNNYFPLWVDAFLIAGVVRDYVATGRVHLAYRASVPFIVLCQLIEYRLVVPYLPSTP